MGFGMETNCEVWLEAYSVRAEGEAGVVNVAESIATIVLNT